MQEPQEQRVITLATQITDILAAHPNPYEADTACSIAKSLTAMRVQFASLLVGSLELKVEQEQVR